MRDCPPVKIYRFVSCLLLLLCIFMGWELRAEGLFNRGYLNTSQINFDYSATSVIQSQACENSCWDGQGIEGFFNDSQIRIAAIGYRLPFKSSLSVVDGWWTKPYLLDVNLFYAKASTSVAINRFVDVQGTEGNNLKVDDVFMKSIDLDANLGWSEFLFNLFNLVEIGWGLGQIDGTFRIHSLGDEGEETQEYKISGNFQVSSILVRVYLLEDLNIYLGRREFKFSNQTSYIGMIRQSQLVGVNLTF